MGDKMSDKTNEPVKELKGLTEQEAALRVEQGLDNRADTTTDKSIKEIIFSYSVLTFDASSLSSSENKTHFFLISLYCETAFLTILLKLPSDSL